MKMVTNWLYYIIQHDSIGYKQLCQNIHFGLGKAQSKMPSQQRKPFCISTEISKKIPFFIKQYDSARRQKCRL